MRLQKSCVLMVGLSLLTNLALADATPDLGRDIEALVAQGVIELELGDATSASVMRDVEALVGDAALLGDLAKLRRTGDATTAPATLAIEYLGRGRSAQQEVHLSAAAAPEVGDETVVQNIEMDAFNVGSGNEFRLRIPLAALAALDEAAQASGLGRGASPAMPGRETSTPENIGAKSWSNGSDDRYRVYGVNAAVTNATDRRLVQLGGFCSGALVGPRHVLTAGHCIWSNKDKSWSDDFWVRAGANGTSYRARVKIDRQNIPAGQALWYFTPSAFRDPRVTNKRPYDFGILVTPGRLGSTTGWLGWYHLNASTLQNSLIRRRGYPSCVAYLNGKPRIDEPSPCNQNHLYANSARCYVGEFRNHKDGWARNFNHSCDASGGDSGSPLYVTRNGATGVTAVHIASLCGATAGSQCSGTLSARPLQALRITPEHSGWISYFRSRFN